MDKKEIDIKECRALQLNMLATFDSFCRNKGLFYSLAFGSLLGAIRHHGYIPWDDDIDVMMPRADYEIFISEFKEDDYIVVCHEINPQYVYPFAKIIDNRTILEENTMSKLAIGLYIDVFPIDNMSNGKMAKLWFQFRKNIVNYVYTLKMVKCDSHRGNIKNFVLCISHFLFKPISWSFLLKRINKLSLTYKNADCLNAGVLVPVDNRMNEIVHKSIFSNYISVVFEYINVMVIKEYDKYLTALYGDYMKLPSEEKRLTHHDHKVYWK